MAFEYFSPTRIIFGQGKLNNISEFVLGFSDYVLVLSGCPDEILNRLIMLLSQNKIRVITKKIDHEPTIESIRILVEYARQFPIGLVIGIGGGSAIDSAKATAALLNNPGDITDYLEVIGLNKPLSNPSLPVIAIPTTFGTGSEVTKNAVLGSQKQNIKVSLRSPFLYPNVAVVDPELAISLPQLMTAFTGLDALTQLIEPYTCIVPNPLTDAICIEGVFRIARSIKTAFETGSDIQAREDMSIASLFSGLALANAKLGAVHGLAGPIGGVTSANHGAICAALLPYVIKANLIALNDRDPKHPAIARYDRIGQILTGKHDADASSGIKWITDFCNLAKIPHLSGLGLSEASDAEIINKALVSSSMKGNPITLSAHELRNILESAM